MLLFILIVKHYLCEMQSDWMAIGKGKPHGYMMPMAMHCGLHAFGTFFVLLALGLQNYAYLALLEFICHWYIDRAKVLLNRKIGDLAYGKAYHRVYVADQCLHFAWYALMCWIVGVLK